MPGQRTPNRGLENAAKIHPTLLLKAWLFSHVFAQS